MKSKKNVVKNNTNRAIGWVKEHKTIIICGGGAAAAGVMVLVVGKNPEVFKALASKAKNEGKKVYKLYESHKEEITKVMKAIENVKSKLGKGEISIIDVPNYDACVIYYDDEYDDDYDDSEALSIYDAADIFGSYGCDEDYDFGYDPNELYYCLTH